MDDPPQRGPSPSARSLDSVVANPVLALAVADFLRKPLIPQEPYTFVPDMQEFFGKLVDSVNLSLSHSFGVGFWKSGDANTWKEIREEVVVSLECALSDPTGLNIFQACSDLLLAPARFLSFLGFVPPVVASKPKFNPADAAAMAASEAIKRGQTRKAVSQDR